MIRRKNNQIQSPIVKLYNKELDKYIVLIGTCHVGKPEYFKTLTEKINNFEENNYKILYEKVMGESENIKIEDDQFENLNNTIANLCQLMNLQFQAEGLQYKDSWINTDLTTAQLEKLLKDNSISVFSSKSMDLSKYNQNVLKWIVRKCFGLMAFAEKFDRIKSIFSKKYKVLINYRNEIAVEGIKKYIENNNVVSIWGAGHIDGIIKLLEKEGFVIKDKEWITYFNV